MNKHEIKRYILDSTTRLTDLLLVPLYKIKEGKYGSSFTSAAKDGKSN